MMRSWRGRARPINIILVHTKTGDHNFEEVGLGNDLTIFSISLQKS